MSVKVKKHIKKLKNKCKKVKKLALVRKKSKKPLPTISLCMIVRDAADRLALCLDSVKNVVDEIIIVDTGSTDNTVAIAKKYTDKIYFYKWNSDFAKARNESIKYATKDWILILDDDEVLTLDSAKKLKKSLSAATKNEDVYAVWIYNCIKEDAEKEIWQKQKYKGFSVHMHNRILRNHCKLKFKSSLHETIKGRDKSVYVSHIHILHYGYSGDMHAKYLRNFAIVKEQLAADPEDFMCQYNFTRAFGCMENCTDTELLKNMDKSIDMYIKANKDKKKHANKSNATLQLIYFNFIEILIARKLYAQAQKYCYSWLTKLTDNWDLTPYVLLGKVLFLSGKYTEAYRILNLVYTKSSNGVPFCAEEQKAQVYSDLYYFLGSVCIIQGEYQKGLRLIRLVKKKYFSNASVDKLIEIAGTQLARLRQPKKSPRKITISLCMIVRDAADKLALCLDSVKNVVDEIIIVDTGSKDNSVQIARKYTDKVYFYKWHDDFAAARNESLKYATKDWILVLDADEALTLDSAQNIRKFLAQSVEDVYTLFCYNCTDKEARREIYQQEKFKINYMDYRVHTRLIRNHQGLQWKNPIWEAVRDNVTGEPHATQAVQILHHEEYRGPDRYKRNLPIVRRWLAEQPDALSAHYCLLETLGSSPECSQKDLIEQMENTVQYFISSKELRDVYNFVINLLITKKYYVQAEKYCHDWMALEKDRYDLWPQLALGKILSLQGKKKEAKTILDAVDAQKDMSFCAEAYILCFQAELQLYRDMCKN